MCCDGCPASYIGKSVGVTGKKMSDENVRAKVDPIHFTRYDLTMIEMRSRRCPTKMYAQKLTRFT